MAQANISGTVLNSGLAQITGKLRVTLDAPIIDTDTDFTVTPRPQEFTINAGNLLLSLVESETAQVTYRFELFEEETILSYFFADGTAYNGPRHFHTDNQWYTGSVQTPDSVLLFEQSDEREISILDFRAIVPNRNAVEFYDLLPTGITTDVLDTSIRRLAELITSNTDFATALRGGPVWRGAYDPNAVYQYNDSVSSGGSSYVFISQTPASGDLPPSSNWQIL